MTEDFIQKLEEISSEDLEKILIEKRKKEGNEKKYIRLQKDDILRLEIEDAYGINTGQILEFDLADIELALKYQNLLEQDKKNKMWFKNQINILKKRPDTMTKKKLMTKNQEDLMKATKSFFDKEVETYNIFLGENGVQKILNGRKLGWTSLQEIENIISEQIMPYLNLSMENIENKIKEKYSQALERNEKILKNE